MSAKATENKDEAVMLTAMNQIAEKHGCKINVDFQNQTIHFDCPNDESKQNLALEIHTLLSE